MSKVNYVRKNIISQSPTYSTKTKISHPSHNKTSEFSNVVKISKDYCKGCRLCIVHCPKGMLKVDSHLNKLGFYPAIFNNKNKNSCSGCRFCVLVCPDGCIEVIKDE